MKENILDCNNILTEAKADQEKFKQWLKDGSSFAFQGELADGQEKYVTELLNDFLALKPRIKSPYNDFYYWMKNSTFGKFHDYIEDLKDEVYQKQSVKQREKDGAELIYSDDTWKVYHIKNYEASAKYGKGTKWCITGTDRWNDGNSGKETFQQYHDHNHVEFYFFIKNGTEKYAVALYPDGETTEIFNAEDVSIAYIPDAPHIEDFPDVSSKDDKKLLINAIASGQIDEGILLGAIEEICNDNDSRDLFITTNPEVASSVLEEKIPDGYLEFAAVLDGKLTKEDYESITGEKLTDEDIEYGWGGDLPEINVSDQYATKAEACNEANFKKHKYWIFFTDYDYWDNSDLFYADDLVGLLNNIYQMLDFQSMYEFVEAIADTILYQIKFGRLDKEAIKDVGVSDEYINSLGESLHLSESEDSDYESLVEASIKNINDFLDEYGFEVELVEDYEPEDYEQDALGLFLNSIQDNASTFPIWLNKEAIINGSKEFEYDGLDIAIMTTIAHEVGHGIFNYLEDFYELDRSEEEDMVEEFARDYYDNNLADDTLYKILQDYMIEDEDTVVESLRKSLKEFYTQGTNFDNFDNEQFDNIILTDELYKVKNMFNNEGEYRGIYDASNDVVGMCELELDIHQNISDMFDACWVEGEDEKPDLNRFITFDKSSDIKDSIEAEVDYVEENLLIYEYSNFYFVNLEGEKEFNFESTKLYEVLGKPLHKYIAYKHSYKSNKGVELTQVESLKESSKYDSAEELLKECGDLVYHATYKDQLENIYKEGLHNFWFGIEASECLDMIEYNHDKLEDEIVIAIPTKYLDVSDCDFTVDTGDGYSDTWAGTGIYNGTITKDKFEYIYDVDEDKYLDESLTEMRGKGNISDRKVVQYIEECIEEMKKINFGFPEEDVLTYDDIDCEEGDTARTFGTMYLPHNGEGNFKLVLNRHMFNEPEEAIKNTILHELCHYVVDKIALDCGAIYSKNGKWYLNNRDFYNAKDYTGHGKLWKFVASKVSNATGQDITRTNSYDMHTGVGSHANDSYKYIVKCKHCGNEFKYMKRTKFVDAVISGNGHVEDWWCNCSDGTKGQDFEIVRGK